MPEESFRAFALSAGLRFAIPCQSALNAALADFLAHATGGPSRRLYGTRRHDGSPAKFFGEKWLHRDPQSRLHAGGLAGAGSGRSLSPAPRWIYPAPVEDLQEAVKWLRTHAVENGIDPDGIATFEYSAGGGPSDLTFYPGGDLVPQFLGGSILRRS